MRRGIGGAGDGSFELPADGSTYPQPSEPHRHLTRIADHRTQLVRLWRYALTSVVATAVSECTLVLIYGHRLLGPAASAVAASLAGTIPSYLMSRYWIWPEADRGHAGRQASEYWLIALVGLGLSSGGTALASSLAPGGRTAHTVVVALAYLAVYGVLWVAKFVVYQRFLFRRPRMGIEKERVHARAR